MLKPFLHFLFLFMLMSSSALADSQNPEFQFQFLYPSATRNSLASLQVEVQSTAPARCVACLDASTCEPLAFRSSSPFQNHFLNLRQLSLGSHRLHVVCNSRDLLPQVLEQDLIWTVVSAEEMQQDRSLEDRTAPEVLLLRPLENAEVGRNFTFSVRTNEVSTCGYQINLPRFGNGLSRAPLVVLDMNSDKGIEHRYSVSTLPEGDYTGQVSCDDRSGNRHSVPLNFRVSAQAEPAPEGMAPSTEIPVEGGPAVGNAAPPQDPVNGQDNSNATGSSPPTAAGLNDSLGSSGACSLSTQSLKLYDFWILLWALMPVLAARFYFIPLDRGS